MFRNPGNKIKVFAVVIFVLLVLFHVLLGVGVMTAGSSVARAGGAGDVDEAVFVVLGILIIVLGFVSSWVSVLTLYAYGALVSDVQTIKIRLLNSWIGEGDGGEA